MYTEKPNRSETGLYLALAQNKQALFYYSCLDSKAKSEIAQRAKSVKTKKEMAEFVDGLFKGPNI